MKYGLHWEAPYLYYFFKENKLIIKPETLEAWYLLRKNWVPTSIDLDFHEKTISDIQSNGEASRIMSPMFKTPDDIARSTDDKAPTFFCHSNTPIKIERSETGPFAFKPGPEGPSFIDWWPEYRKEKNNILVPFFDSFPPETAQACYWYRRHVWEMMLSFKKFPGLIVLARSNKALAYIITFNKHFSQGNRWRKKILTNITFMKRREIAKLAGFPDSENTVKLLAKTTPDACQYPELLSLRDLMNIPKILRTLNYIPFINLPVLYILSDPQMPHSVSNKFMMELSRNFRQYDNPRFNGNPSERVTVFRNIEFLIKDTVRMKPSAKIKSIKQLIRLHNHLVIDQQNEKKRIIAATERRPFPEAPFQGNPDLKPITSALELFQEGIDQNNCVFSYLNEVISGDFAIYSVLKPERATLSLRKDGEKWRLDQIKLAWNQEPSDETWALAKKWMGQHGILSQKSV